MNLRVIFITIKRLGALFQGTCRVSPPEQVLVIGRKKELVVTASY